MKSEIMKFVKQKKLKFWIQIMQAIKLQTHQMEFLSVIEIARGESQMKSISTSKGRKISVNIAQEAEVETESRQ